MKIQNKLFLSLFSFSLILVTVLVLLMQWSIDKGMIEYVNTKEVEAIKPLVTTIIKEYKKHNDWSTLQGKHEKFAELVFSKLIKSGFIDPMHEFRRPPLDFPKDYRNNDNFEPDFVMVPTNQNLPQKIKRDEYILFDSEKNLIAGHQDKGSEYNSMSIDIGERVVGYLAMPKRDQITDGYELEFIEQQKSYLWIIALISMILVTIVTLPLARHVVGPINLLMFGVHRLTKGNFDQRIESKRKDELGELSRDFNDLALTLEENESARKRWLANISHELRTPVAILRGELEAMIDKVRPLNAENIASANDEVKHLQYLIDDLHQLTSADIGGMSYQKKSTDVAFWLTSELDRYSTYLADAGIKFEMDMGDKEAMVFVDTSRLCQLFDNLINNCIKYAQASLVKISIKVDDAAVIPSLKIKVEDNGIGVAKEHLSNLFEYLYRVDDSRNRKTGGTGLGLSICAHIVAAHQGNISAERSSLGGLAIIIDLPLSK